MSPYSNPTTQERPPSDPYRFCDRDSDCSHDVVPGVLIAELRDGDGPYPLTFSPPPSLVLGALRAALTRSTT